MERLNFRPMIRKMFLALWLFISILMLGWGYECPVMLILT